METLNLKGELKLGELSSISDSLGKRKTIDEISHTKGLKT